jgi:hypothetical protein
MVWGRLKTTTADHLSRLSHDDGLRLSLYPYTCIAYPEPVTFSATTGFCLMLKIDASCQLEIQ